MISVIKDILKDVQEELKEVEPGSSVHSAYKELRGRVDPDYKQKRLEYASEKMEKLEKEVEAETDVYKRIDKYTKMARLVFHYNLEYDKAAAYLDKARNVILVCDIDKSRQGAMLYAFLFFIERDHDLLDSARKTGEALIRLETQEIGLRRN